MPEAMRQVVKIAHGGKAIPRGAQLDATRLLAGAARIDIEARAAGRPGGPLAELPLTELEGTLSGLLGKVHELQALDTSGESPENSVHTVGTQSAQDGADAIEGERLLSAAAVAPGAALEQQDGVAAPGRGEES